jgi:hypothetical protein
MMQEGLLLETSTAAIEPSSPIRLWKIYLILGSMVAFLFVGSAIICGSDEKCRNHIPTVANMLNSTLATPFLVTGFNAALVVHFVTVASIAFVAKHKAPYWAMMQMLAAVLVYGSTVTTLFVLPFTGWTNNWANIFILCTMAVWMMLAQVALRRGLRNAMGWPFTSMTILYVLCVIPYIVVRAMPTLPIPNKDIGMLVCQTVGACALVTFIIVCIIHVWKVGVRLYHPESKID